MLLIIPSLYKDNTIRSTCYGHRRLLGQGPSTDGSLVATGSLTLDEAFELEKEMKADTESTLRTESYASTSASFSAQSNGLERPGNAPYMYMPICMRDESGVIQRLSCLLDTGASEDCMSKSCAKRLAPGPTNLIRKTNTPLVLPIANGDMIESRLKVQGTWSMQNRDQDYKHLFYLIDGLPTDVVLSRQTIFQHGFLLQNTDLLSLEMSPTPGLNILGFPSMSKGTSRSFPNPYYKF